MDITNNVSSINEKKQEGGSEENSDEEIESSDYDVNMSEFSNNNFTDIDINKILDGNENTLDLKNFNINDLNKNPSFNKLSNNQKTLIINRIIDKLPKSSKIIKATENSGITKESYFYCKTCGYFEKIPDKMFIFSRGIEKKDDMFNYNFLNYLNDNTLPNSKNYNCINDKCETHKNPNIKLAVFFRNHNSYNTKYMCTVCNFFWNTFIEK